MRITGGKAKSRKLLAPKTKGKEQIRPTSDRVREALLSIIGNKMHGARVLDLYAGTGSFGLDALSRGAQLVVFIDKLNISLKLIQQNLQSCFDQVTASILRLDLEKQSSYNTLLNRTDLPDKYDIIFLDPPYEKKIAETTLTMIEKTGLLAPKGMIIAEERSNVTLPKTIKSLHLNQQRRYGETGIWIYKQTREQ